jgi:sulfotransferase family protein
MNPFVFLVGCPRSGTTLLYRLVDAHPEIALVHETLWIPRFWERRIGVSPDGSVTPELVPNVVRQRRFERMGIPADEVRRLVEGNGRVSYASFVTALFDRFGAARGKLLAGDKTPAYVRSVPVLHELWPEAKFIHLIRDGRDVCLSALDWRKADKVFCKYDLWRDEPVTTAALWWERCVRLGREAGRELPPSLYHEVRYEALVADPESASRELCAFLGVDYHDSMLRFHEGKTRDAFGLPTKRRWLPPTEGLRDWRAQMSRAALREFEAVAGGLIDELGYERGDFLDADLVVGAAEARDRFATVVAERSRPLPEAWA